MLLQITLLLGLVSSQQRLAQEVRIPLEDGVFLLGDLYRPSVPAPYPTVLHMTPYSRRQHAQTSGPLVDRGLAVLIVSARGTTGSGGRPEPFLGEIEDGSAVLAWLLAQPWSTDRVGLFGFSSESYTAQRLASTGHPAIRTLVNASGLTDTELLFFPGGAFRLDTLFPWLQFNYVGEPLESNDAWNEAFQALPLQSAFGWKPGLLERMRQSSVQLGGIQVPVLHFTGWNDVVYRQTLRFHQGLAQRGESAPFQKLIVGPWQHNNLPTHTTRCGDEDFGPEAEYSGEVFLEMVGDWFDRFLNAEENGIEEEPPVSMFVMGENEWLERFEYPPEDSHPRTLHLSWVEGLGRLSEQPVVRASTCEFQFDPLQPVPTDGGVNSHLFPSREGPKDQSHLSSRDDVRVYTSSTLAEEWTLAGPIRVVLTMSSSAPSTDLTAKLLVLRPDGYARIVEDGITRIPAAVGAAAIAPCRVEIELGATALRIPAGHRIQLHISSSNFPKYDRNPNTGENAREASLLKPADQILYHSKTQPAFLELTVLE